MDDQQYLEPGFDPASLTVPILRGLLVKHGVNYPSGAKKGQLVDLFHEHIAPQARKLRTDSLRVKRTSRGIVDVGSVDDNDDEEPEPPSTGRRRTTRARTEEAQEVPSTTRSTRHSTAPPESTTPRRASSKHARALEKIEEPEPKRPASRKSRQSMQTPVVKQEVGDDDSPFSAENVFQSGNSPPERRRSGLSASRDADRRRSREVRRRTEEVKPSRRQLDGVVVPSKKSFEMPVSAMKKEYVEPSEEFTPEEQQELDVAEQSGEVVAVRPRSARPAARAAKHGLGAMFTALLAGFAYLWSEEKFKIGYCGQGMPSTEIAGVEIPEWADVMRPPCEACPPHAICYERLVTDCEPGFVLTHNPFSLGGRLPIPPTCEPDNVRTRNVNQVKQRVVQELRDANAKFECGEATSAEVKETALKDAIGAKRRKGMSNEEFEGLWDSAIGEVRGEEEVVEGVDGSLRSRSLDNLPLTCALRRSLLATLREHIRKLIALATLTSLLLYTRHRLLTRRETSSRAKLLASQVYDLLSHQAFLRRSDPSTYRESYVPVAQLRDDVLRDEYSSWRRRRLWERVQGLVEHNSNVRSMQREVGSGDVGRVWEWVGRTTGDGGARRKSGRVSFGGEQWILPSEENSEVSSSEVSRWTEGGSRYY